MSMKDHFFKSLYIVVKTVGKIPQTLQIPDLHTRHTAVVLERVSTSSPSRLLHCNKQNHVLQYSSTIRLEVLGNSSV